VASLPWVDPASIIADGDRLQVKFTVTDPAKYSESAVISTITEAGYPGSKKLTGPSLSP
jgi:hypothetical protein